MSTAKNIFLKLQKQTVSETDVCDRLIDLFKELEVISDADEFERERKVKSGFFDLYLPRKKQFLS